MKFNFEENKNFTKKRKQLDQFHSFVPSSAYSFLKSPPSCSKIPIKDFFNMVKNNANKSSRCKSKKRTIEDTDDDDDDEEKEEGQLEKEILMNQHPHKKGKINSSILTKIIPSLLELFPNFNKQSTIIRRPVGKFDIEGTDKSPPSGPICDGMSDIVMLEFLAIAVGLMPEDGNYFDHISLMLESLLSAIITNHYIPGNKYKLP